MVMQLSKHFNLEDFIPPEIIRDYGQAAQWFLDPVLVALMDFMADHFGAKVIINNWKAGGALQYRGFRPPSYTGGGKLSQHRFGRASDFNVEGKTPQEIYKGIFDNERLFMDHGLSAIEDIDKTPTWNHIDIRWTGSDQILVVRP